MIVESKGETFNDVMFVPQYSEILHRHLISTETDMGKIKLALPIISSNMADITGPKMAAKMASMGGLGILHRFSSSMDPKKVIEENVRDYKLAVHLLESSGVTVSPFSIGVSVGVQEQDKLLLQALYDAGARLFTIDVAHGHHILVSNMIKHMRSLFGDEICIIAGNVATFMGASALYRWGADIIKVGVGPGSRCMTRRNTGVGVPQLRAIRDIRQRCRDYSPPIKIIADGGIKHYGDIPKALLYADAVMVGSLVAGTSETPGHVYANEHGEHYKVFGGSASGERKADNGKDQSFVEGVVKEVKFKGKVKYILKAAKENLQSCMSYAGAENLDEFRENAVLEDIGSGAKEESKI